MDFKSAAAVVEATNELEKFLKKCKYQAIEKCAEEVDSDSDILDILEDLCEMGVDLNHLENERGIALITHVFWSRILIKFFLDRGANINSKDENEDTALHLAIREAGSENMKIKHTNGGPKYNPVNVVKFLTKHSELDPNVTNSRGETPLFLLQKKSIYFWETGSGPEVERMLVGNGASDDAVPQNRDFEFKLHDSNYWNYVKGDENAAIDFVNNRRTPIWCYSKTPLMVTASESPVLVAPGGRIVQLETCEELIEQWGADVNATDLQGYTALHHAVLDGAHERAEYLFQVGADPNAKTSSGRDVYDLSVSTWRRNNCFTQGATPEKKIQILEISGAALLLNTLFVNFSAFFDVELEAFRYWDMVLDVCNEAHLQISQEFLDNNEFIRANLRNPEHRDEMMTRCMNTIARLSEGPNSKFWTLLQFSPLLKMLQDGLHPFSSRYIFQILDFLSSEEFKRTEDFASLEETDFAKLLGLVRFFDSWFIGRESREIPVTPERISQFHSIARLTVACFSKLTHVTKDKKVEYGDLYITLFNALTSLRSNFGDVIMSEQAINENKRLLKNLIDLDLRDRDSNTLKHLVLGDENGDSNSPRRLVYNMGGDRSVYFKFKSVRVVAALLETVDDVTTKNEMGFEPVQTTHWKKWNVLDQEILDVFVEMADRGAHVDARNAICGEPTLREVFEKGAGRPDLAFRFDTLQCACARVLARNLVPYRNRVPKKMVDFIHEHLQ